MESHRGLIAVNHDKAEAHSPPKPTSWKWMVSGTAAAGAAASTVQAEIVQITQTNSELTLSANNLKTDITGDQITDLDGLYTYRSTDSWTRYVHSNSFRTLLWPKVIASVDSFTNRAFFGTVNGYIEYAAWTARYLSSTKFHVITSSGGAVQVGSYRGQANSAGNFSGVFPFSAKGYTAITFTDSRINNGLPTSGFMEVLGTMFTKNDPRIQLVRLIFDDQSTDLSFQSINPDAVYPEFFSNDDPLFEPDLNPTRNDPVITQQRLKLAKKIKKLKSKLRKAKGRGDRASISKLKSKVKKFSYKYKAAFGVRG